MKKASLVAARNEKILQGRTLLPKVELLGKGQPWQPQAVCNLEEETLHHLDDRGQWAPGAGLDGVQAQEEHKQPGN